MGDRAGLSGDAAHHAKAWEGPVHPLSTFVPQEGAIIIDAVLVGVLPHLVTDGAKG